VNREKGFRMQVRYFVSALLHFFGSVHRVPVWRLQPSKAGLQMKKRDPETAKQINLKHLPALRYGSLARIGIGTKVKQTPAAAGFAT